MSSFISKNYELQTTRYEFKLQYSLNTAINEFLIRYDREWMENDCSLLLWSRIMPENHFV